MAVGGLNECAERPGAIGALEGMESRQSAAGRDLEYGAAAWDVRAAREVATVLGGSVEFPVGGLEQAGERRCAIRAVGLGAKPIEDDRRSSRYYFVDRAAAWTMLLGAHLAEGRSFGGAVEIAVGALNERGGGIAIALGEVG